MKRKITVFKVSSDRIFEAVCILMFVTSLIPWFSISDVISSYYGFQIVFEHYLWIPFVCLAVCLCLDKKEHRLIRIVLAEASFLGIFGILARSFLYFRRYKDLIFDGQTGIDIAYSLSCTLPAFWITAALAATAFILLQYRIFKTGRHNAVCSLQTA